MTNMKVLQKSRKKQSIGDIFTLQILEGKFHWGRVVSLSATAGGFEDCILIYIYSVQTDNDDVVPELDTSQLLLPPIAINQQPWTRGYFKTIESRPLAAEDLLPVHCFYSFAFRKYYDDNGNVLASKSEPCGVYGLASYRTVDDDLSRALGLEEAPD